LKRPDIDLKRFEADAEYRKQILFDLVHTSEPNEAIKGINIGTANGLQEVHTVNEHVKWFLQNVDLLADVKAHLEQLGHYFLDRRYELAGIACQVLLKVRIVSILILNHICVEK
jgi:hypothetical protein